MVIAGGGNTSFKTADRLWVKASGHALATIDEEGFAGLIARLDQLIALLSAGLTPPAAAGDEDPDAGDIAEIVQEVIETAEKSSSNPAETAESIAEIVEEIVL